ncbi:nitroreductase/quinone reductase family protein [Pseudonocardia nematodicida]|uniref:Nitroreductase/quinone reductase family protein n=1 Tax=Pseudonocardia nematodicida TaxID=1206997 RepID=A0ABV1K358_9PSEU
MDHRHYRAPGRLSRMLNPLVVALVQRGRLPGATAVLAVPGRVSGRERTVPLTPVTVGGRRYLISPRGETDWVLNLRAAGGRAELRAGAVTDPVLAMEQSPVTAVPVLRAYLDGLGRSAGLLFDDIGPGSSDAEITAAAHRHPVFELCAPRAG